jgi:hypothetical protein
MGACGIRFDSQFASRRRAQEEGDPLARSESLWRCGWIRIWRVRYWWGVRVGRNEQCIILRVCVRSTAGGELLPRGAVRDAEVDDDAHAARVRSALHRPCRGPFAFSNVFAGTTARQSQASPPGHLGHLRGTNERCRFRPVLMGGLACSIRGVYWRVHEGVLKDTRGSLSETVRGWYSQFATCMPPVTCIIQREAAMPPEIPFAVLALRRAADFLPASFVLYPQRPSEDRTVLERCARAHTHAHTHARTRTHARACAHTHAHMCK